MTSFQEFRKQAIAKTKQKIRESVTEDNNIINSIATLEEIDRVTNRLSRKLRDWYALYNPELEHEYNDHKAFVDAVLENPQPDRNGMGGTISDENLGSILAEAQIISTLYAQRDLLLAHLEALMEKHAPNVTAVAGAIIGAQLLQLARSLRRMAMMPAGTIQLLGAENALFRHLHNKHKKPPKHGVIFNHKVIQQSRRERHGKLARVLADCIAIAARVDYFKGEFCGDTLRKKVDDT